MYSSIANHVLVLGRLTADPLIKIGKNGKEYACFSLAINEWRKGDEKTTFIPFIAFSHQAQYMKKFHKGERLYICASIENKPDTESEKKEYNFSFIVHEIQFADKREKIEGESKADEFVDTAESDDLPDAFNIGEPEVAKPVETKSTKAEKPSKKENESKPVKDGLSSEGFDFDEDIDFGETEKEEHVNKMPSKKESKGNMFDADGFFDDPFAGGDFL